MNGTSSCLNGAYYGSHGFAGTATGAGGGSGGGGGGYVGGGDGGGGGGSSYVGGAPGTSITNASIVDGVLSPDNIYKSNGEVVISYTDPPPSCVANCTPSTATPELGSDELLATGLLPLGLALVLRRRWARRTTQQ